MSCKRRAFVLFLIGLLLLKEPAWILAQPTPVASPNAVVPGLVIIVEGIGGIDLIGKSATIAVKRAGLPHDIHHFTWTHGTGQFLKDLQDTQHILKKADELAEFIKDYRAKIPTAPSTSSPRAAARASFSMPCKASPPTPSNG